MQTVPRGHVCGETARRDFVLDLLSEQFTKTEAEAVFETLVSWIRACGLFRYSREQDRFRPGDGPGDALESEEDDQG